MIKSTVLLLVFLSLWLCSCFTISIDTAGRRTWETATPEHREQYLELKPILTDEQADSFLQMTDEKQRNEWLRKFWKSKDPTPTSEKNEFKEEHERRVARAKYYFGSHFRNNRLWDDRGEVYVKYGEPDERIMGIEGWWDWKKELNRRPAPEVADEAKEDAKKAKAQSNGDPRPLFKQDYDYNDAKSADGEIWRYYKYNLTLQFQESKSLGYYELVPYVEKSGSDFMGGATYKTQNYADFKSTVADKIEIPREIYKHDYGGEALDYALDIIRFRNTKDDYELNVSVGIPAKQLAKKDTNYVSFVKSVVVFDSAYKEIGRDSSIFGGSINQSSNYLVISHNKFILKPGQYQVAVEIRDLISNRVGIYKKDILLPSYVRPEQREISQIVMATDIKEATPKDSSSMQRNGLVISSLPSKIYFPDQKIYFYYEIYDLKTDQEGKGYYIIQADLVNTKTRKRVNLYTTNPIESKSSNTYEMDKIDASKLKPADYILYIKIKDVLADKEKKTVTAFRVEDK